MTPEVIEGMIRSCDYGSYELQWIHAIEVLVSNGGDDAAALFSELMRKDPDKFPASVIQRARDGLIAMGPEAIESLVHHANQSHEVLTALIEMEDPRVHDLLVERVLPHHRIHYDYHRHLLDALLDFLGRSPKATLAAIRRQLPAAVPQVQGYLARGLGVCGEEAAPDLLALLDAAETDTVLAAILGLGRAAPDLQEARARLQLFVEDPRADVQEAALWALSQGASEEALALLLARFAAPLEEPQTRQQLRRELVASPVSNEAIRAPLLAYFEAPEDDQQRYRDVIYVLQERKDTEVIPALLALALQRDDFLLRRRIFQAIGEMGMGQWSEPLASLLDHEDLDLRCAASEVLLKLKPERFAAQILAATIDDPDDRVRWGMYKALAEHVPGRFVEAIPSLLPWMRSEAFGPMAPPYEFSEVLFAHDHPALLELYVELAKSPTAGGYMMGLEGLGRRGGPGDVPLLLEGFHHFQNDPNEIFWYVITPLERLTTRIEASHEDASGVATQVLQYLSAFVEEVEDDDIELVAEDEDGLDGLEDVEALVERWQALAAAH